VLELRMPRKEGAGGKRIRIQPQPTAGQVGHQAGQGSRPTAQGQAGKQGMNPAAPPASSASNPASSTATTKAKK
jgi:hypothetical protein